MASSKVLVPTAPFAKLQVKKTPPEQGGSGFLISNGDAAARIAHLEHSVRFLQEQHRLMLSGLHAEIEALRERNRDLQFQLIFNKESSPKTTPVTEEIADSNEEHLKKDVSRLEREAAAARGEARAAEARALQLQRLVDAQAEKLRELELETKPVTSGEAEEAESRAELRARLAEAERLVRRLRADAERQRREVQPSGGGAATGGVTNLLFDGAHAQHAHLQCMKNSLHASLRASGVDGYYQSNYHFPPVPAPDFWREPVREDFSRGGVGAAGLGVAGVGVLPVAGGARRPVTLPELAVHHPRAPHYNNNHRYRVKKNHITNNENIPKMPEESPGALKSLNKQGTYPELKIVIAKLISHDMVGIGEGGSRRSRRPAHRKHAPDHT